LTRLGEPDELLKAVLDALTMQAGACGEILLIEQKTDSALEAGRFSNDRWNVRTLRQRFDGLSAARNASLREAAHDMILFCDADAIAAPDWAAALHAALAEPGVAIAGSRIVPRWSGRPPLLARSKVVLDQYSVYDLGPDSFEVLRVVGAGFGLDRSECGGEMHFDEALGRRDGRLFGGEESDLCRRVAAAGGRIVYVGAARIEHVIQPERTRTGWILKRLFYAGHGRGRLGGQPSPSRRPSLADWLLLLVILPPYLLGWVWGRATR
jgi:hypothetical protein